MNLSKIKPSGVIHIFALLHAAVTILCLEAGIGDELFLTVLTMAMILLVCLKKNLNLEFTAGIIIIINVTGYLLGTAGANLIGMIFSSDLAVHAISTAFTTELLGWSTILVGNILNRLRLSSGSIRMPHMPWLIAPSALIDYPYYIKQKWVQERWACSLRASDKSQICTSVQQDWQLAKIRIMDLWT